MDSLNLGEHMEFENYILYLRNHKHLSHKAVRLTQKALERFTSFLVNESVVELGAVNASLLHRYAETFSNLTPSSARHQLAILCQYFEYIATTGQQPAGPQQWFSARLRECDSSASSALTNPKDSMQSRLTLLFPSMSQFYKPTLYVPSFDDIRRLIEEANSHERTQPVGDLAYIVASTGLRMGELANLRVTDIVSNQGQVRIESKHLPVNRYVPLSPRTLQGLASLHKRFPESELVFGNRPRSYLQGLTVKLELLAGKVGAENMQLHSLRRAVLAHLYSLVKTSQEETAVRLVTGHANLGLPTGKRHLQSSP